MSRPSLRQKVSITDQNGQLVSKITAHPSPFPSETSFQPLCVPLTEVVTLSLFSSSHSIPHLPALALGGNSTNT